MKDHIPLPAPDYTEDVQGFVHDTQRHYYSEETMRAYAERLHAARVKTLPTQLMAGLQTEIDALHHQLQTLAELGDASGDAQILRTGYAAARLEIESLNTQLQAAREEIKLRDAQEAAIGAGGVEPLRRRECLHKIAEPETASQPPAGWVLVPAEPTTEMLQAGRNEPLATQDEEDSLEDYRAVYRAMLAAAPAAVAGPAIPPHAITASVMRDDGGARPAFCLMAAYRSEKEATDALALLASAPTTQAAPAAQGDALSQAARDVLAERQRQINAEGWTPRHDDGHVNTIGEPEMAIAAACYAMAGTSKGETVRKLWWPWASKWWKPTTPRRNLEKAGALILAEIERLDRVSARSQAKEGGA